MTEKAPPAPGAPGFGQQASKAWRDTLLGWKQGFEGVVLWAVADAPTLLMFVAIVILIAAGVRHALRLADRE